MGIFCPFTPLTAQKWKCQKNKTNTWRYNHLTQAYQKSCSYALLLLWNMAHDRCNCYFSFWAFFALLPLWQPEKWKLQKSEKTPGDIILHKCTKNHDHVLYCSWDMAHDTCNCYFSYWVIFFVLLPPPPPPTPLIAQKSKFQKNEKNTWRYHHFTHVPQIMIRWCTVPEIWCMTDRQTDKRMDRKSDI